MLRVQPEAHKWVARSGFALRDLVFVMGKCKIDSAGMDIQSVTQIFHSHRGTLDVPARASGTNARLPEEFAGLGRLPQRKVACIRFLVTIHVHTRASLNSAHVHFGE